MRRCETSEAQACCCTSRIEPGSRVRVGPPSEYHDREARFQCSQLLIGTWHDEIESGLFFQDEIGRRSKDIRPWLPIQRRQAPFARPFRLLTQLYVETVDSAQEKSQENWFSREAFYDFRRAGDSLVLALGLHVGRRRTPLGVTAAVVAGRERFFVFAAGRIASRRRALHREGSVASAGAGMHRRPVRSRLKLAQGEGRAPCGSASSSSARKSSRVNSSSAGLCVELGGRAPLGRLGGQTGEPSAGDAAG